MTGHAYQEREWRKERLLSALLIFFGAFALVISCLGVYGILEYLVRSRTPELGIRMALGAQPRAVIRMVIADSVQPLAWGIGGGVVAAVIVTRSIESLLFQVSRYDLPTFSGAAAIVMLTGGGAAFLASRRAARIAPISAIRHE
jgi:ABC-type antimicrobial peptide transport system permease subunit